MFFRVPFPVLCPYLLTASPARPSVPDTRRPDAGSAPMLSEAVVRAGALVCGCAGALQADVWVICSALPGASLGHALRSQGMRGAKKYVAGWVFSSL